MIFLPKSRFVLGIALASSLLQIQVASAQEPVPATTVACDQEYALCAFANCTLSDDLKTASCRCYAFDDGKAGTSIAMVGLIPDPAVLEETQSVCDTPASCGSGGDSRSSNVTFMENEAPLCDAIASNELWPGADLVSTYSSKRQVANGVQFDNATGAALPTWTCPAAANRLVPVCMLAPCVYDPEGPSTNPYNAGRSHMVCTCPLVEATVEYNVVGGLQDPCSNDPSAPGDYVTAAGGPLAAKLMASENLEKKWAHVAAAFEELVAIAAASRETESPTEDATSDVVTLVTGLRTLSPTDEDIAVDDLGGGLPINNEGQRYVLSPEECTSGNNGIVVGDIGNGAIFQADYLCESNGQEPIGNLLFDLDSGEPIPIEGAVCCGPSPATDSLTMTARPTTVAPVTLPTSPESEYVTLDTAAGGCIGRKQDGSDELFLKECTANDEYIQWRLDDSGRFRSRVNDNECMQAGQWDELQAGIEALMSGVSMYVKDCGRDFGTKYDYQVFDESFATIGGLSGPLFLASRPDLCVVHFGADPALGESRIMLTECAELGGFRALGWEADNPCTHAPDGC